MSGVLVQGVSLGCLRLGGLLPMDHQVCSLAHIGGRWWLWPSVLLLVFGIESCRAQPYVLCVWDLLCVLVLFSAGSCRSMR
jgi:hypothetical protein